MTTLAQEVSQLVVNTNALNQSIQQELLVWQQARAASQALVTAQSSNVHLRTITLNVNGDTGDDTNDGHADRPLKTLNKALTMISSLNFSDTTIYLHGQADFEMVALVPLNLNGSLVRIIGIPTLNAEGVVTFMPTIYRRQTANPVSFHACHLSFNFVKYVDEKVSPSTYHVNAFFQLFGSTVILGEPRTEAMAENTASFIFESIGGAPFMNFEGGGSVVANHCLFKNLSTINHSRSPIVGRAMSTSALGVMYQSFLPLNGTYDV
jgi:hypothetical protein